jgi:hypothetical protein
VVSPDLVPNVLALVSRDVHDPHRRIPRSLSRLLLLLGNGVADQRHAKTESRSETTPNVQRCVKVVAPRVTNDL